MKNYKSEINCINSDSYIRPWCLGRGFPEELVCGMAADALDLLAIKSGDQPL